LRKRSQTTSFVYAYAYITFGLRDRRFLFSTPAGQPRFWWSQQATNSLLGWSHWTLVYGFLCFDTRYASWPTWSTLQRKRKN